MPQDLFQVEVLEIREQTVLYIVEAGSPKEALEKAKKGEVTEQKELGSEEVLGRKLVSEAIYLTNQQDASTQEEG